MAVIGRQDALDVIDGVLAAIDADGDRAGVLRVSGEAGIGKTCLLAELGRRAADRGYRVFGGRAAEFDAGMPFGPVVDALDQQLSAEGSEILERLVPRDAADLAGAFPALARRARSEPVLTAERHRLHRAIGSLLAAMAEDAPLALTLDDLHWADEATLELVLHLLEAPPRRVLTVITDRQASVDERLAAAVARAASAGRAIAVELGPLSRTEAAQLIDERLADEVLDEFYAESGGNPLFFVELARARDLRDPTGGGSTDVPPLIQAVIAGEIAALPTDAAAFAAGGAVAGDPFDPDAAGVAAGLDGSRTMTLLDDLLTAGLLVTTDQPRLFRFRHPVVRRAVYERAGAGWRLAAHGRLAAHLSAEGASPLVVARHVAAVAKRGDDHAIDLLSAAGRLVLPTSPATAAGWYDHALRLLRDGDDARRIDLLSRKAAALRDSGRTIAARQTLTEAVALVAPEDAGLRVMLAVECAATEHLLGMMDEAHARLHAVLGALGDEPTALHATLLAELAVNAGWYRGDWDSAQRFAADAIEVSRRTDAGAVEALALVVRAFADYTSGRGNRARAGLDRAAELVDRLAEHELSSHLDALYYLARAEFFTDRTDSALRHADRGIAICHGTGRSSPLLQLLRGVRAGALRNQGRFDEATLAAEECVDAARLSTDAQALLTTLMDLLWVHTARGNMDAALPLANQTLALAATLPPTMLNTTVTWGAAWAHLEAGDHERAAMLLLGPQGRASLDAAPLPGPILAWHLIARALTRRGNLDDAQNWLDRIEAAIPHVDDMAAPHVWRGTAASELLLARDKPHEAAEALLAAAEKADGSGLCFEASRSRLLAGRALGIAADRSRAVALLERSRKEMEIYGAPRYYDQATQELRRLGQRVGRSGRRTGAAHGVDALSDRERSIAELVAAGRTNNEIAATLFLSPRTVERHLTHVFDKLGIESRAQLGKLLAAGDDR